jgi:hypothetical protein
MSELSRQSYRDDRERGLFHLLNGETAHGLTIVKHDDEPPKATRTYMLNLNIGWADRIIAERMYLSDARGIAYLLADALDCVVSDVEGGEDDDG